MFDAGCVPCCAGQEAAVEVVKDPRFEAFEKQLEEVKSSSGDFDKWCQLLSAAEKLVCCSLNLSHDDSACCETSTCCRPSQLAQTQSTIVLTRAFGLCPVQGDLKALREVYDDFLSSYPLCYGYWKKYAEIQLKHGSVEDAKSIYERGVAAISNSVELWLAYANFLQANGGSSEEIRR
jgi:hypothetical protein